MNQHVESRSYHRSECIVFRKTHERFGGLSNMAAGYPLDVNGLHIGTSEALYQACRFPHRPDVQKIILSQRSPMTAKMKSKPFRGETRADWEEIKTKVMRWCLRVKLAQNWERFSLLLTSTASKPIVEDSDKDDFWGAKPVDENLLVGRNVLGRLLMELREQVRVHGRERFEEIPAPNISDFLLMDIPVQSVTGLRSKTYLRA